MSLFFNLADKITDNLIKPVAVLLGLFVAIAFVTGIVARSILGEAIFGLEELVLLAVIWFYMLGTALASKEQSHLQADFIPIIFKNQRVICGFRILSTLISMAMAGLFVLWSNDLLQWGLLKKQSTPVFSIPWYCSQVSLLVAAVMMEIYLLRDLLDDIKQLQKQKSKSVTPSG